MYELLCHIGEGKRKTNGENHCYYYITLVSIFLAYTQDSQQKAELPSPGQGTVNKTLNLKP